MSLIERLGNAPIHNLVARLFGYHRVVVLDTPREGHDHVLERLSARFRRTIEIDVGTRKEDLEGRHDAPDVLYALRTDSLHGSVPSLVPAFAGKGMPGGARLVILVDNGEYKAGAGMASPLHEISGVAVVLDL
jgi:hypothetical protein